MDDFACQWPYTSMTQPRETGINGLNAFFALSAQLETLSRKLDAVAAESTQSIAVPCDFCADNHPSHQCTVSFGPVQYGGDYLNNYAYPDYHQDWGYHPDSTWSYNYEDQYYAPSPAYAPEFSCPPPLPQEENSSLVELMSRMIANQEEMMTSQETSTQNLNNQMEQLINTSTYGPQYMNSETDGLPELNLQLDEPQDVEIGETSGEQEKEAEDPALSSNENESIVLVPQVPSPPKFKNPVSFAHPCPLDSHITDTDLEDMKESALLTPWWYEEE